MGFGALRDLVLALNFGAFGLPVTIRFAFPGGDPISTTGIWLTPLTELEPLSSDVGRQHMRRVLALKRSAVPSVPRGTRIEAPALEDGAVQGWIVDGVEREEVEHLRVVVVPDRDFVPEDA